MNYGSTACYTQFEAGFLMWFVDKLGPTPGAAPSNRPAQANGAAQAAAPPRTQAAPQKSAPAPEPEKKKKKGWF